MPAQTQQQEQSQLSSDEASFQAEGQGQGQGQNEAEGQGQKIRGEQGNGAGQDPGSLFATLILSLLWLEFIKAVAVDWGYGCEQYG